MATKKTETKPQLSPQKGRKPFTDEDASDINFFKEDVEAMDRQCEESEKLYTEIHDLFASTSGGDYVPQRNLRDISELTKSLTATRSLCIQAVTSRVSIKKTISDIVAKRKGELIENTDIQILVFSMQELDNFHRAARGENVGTICKKGE